MIELLLIAVLATFFHATKYYKNPLHCIGWAFAFPLYWFVVLIIKAMG